MSLESIYDKLTEIIRDTFDDDDVVATPGLTADQVDGWDSLAHLRLIFKVERVFGVAFSPSQIDSLKNVGDLAQLISSKVAV